MLFPGRPRDRGGHAGRARGVIRIATAGWTIPKAVASAFDGDGSHLERYARAMRAVEIDSSFYRPHRRSTYARWAATTPEDFRFAVKLPRAVTHEAKLVDATSPLDAFMDQVGGLGDKLGVLLVQLAPSLAFDSGVSDRFFVDLRLRHAGSIACEPRHRTWFDDEADALLARHRVTRVAADPALSAVAARPGGDTRELAYFRWHGSPRTYWSAYPDDWLAARAAEVRECRARETWCVFDNTGAGAALDDACRFVRIADAVGSPRASPRMATPPPLHGDPCPSPERAPPSR